MGKGHIFLESGNMALISFPIRSIAMEIQSFFPVLINFSEIWRSGCRAGMHTILAVAVTQSSRNLIKRTSACDRPLSESLEGPAFLSDVFSNVVNCCCCCCGVLLSPQHMQSPAEISLVGP